MNINSNNSMFEWRCRREAQRQTSAVREVNNNNNIHNNIHNNSTTTTTTTTTIIIIIIIIIITYIALPTGSAASDIGRPRGPR